MLFTYDTLELLVLLRLVRLVLFKFEQVNLVLARPLFTAIYI